jgi:cephalosporin hydroxylase
MQKFWDEEFEVWRNRQLEIQIADVEFKEKSKDWVQAATDLKFSYQFNWLGIPIIQLPGDLVMFQEIVYNTKPDLVLEIGVARGGSLVFWASMQELCGIKDGKVLGVDIDIRNHTKQAISSSTLTDRIQLIEGSSIEQDIFLKVKEYASHFSKIMVVLDSNHAHDHVLRELEFYAELVSPNCFLLVLDTVIDELKKDPSREWGPDANPKTAIIEFMSKNKSQFSNQNKYEARAGLTVAPMGYWLRNGLVD